ncbi:MAG: helix-turn-helix transcriptional regulator, partial [Microbacteriaceae bacterium]|nr:helix-turn-helix transcriptional regulator [Microbacteriaceae bacterium]
MMNMTDNHATMTISAPIRVEPVQARSTARVNALLDAACETMHQLGYEQLTTAMVAERAGASIGTVYRYFPDRIAVLQAV